MSSINFNLKRIVFPLLFIVFCIVGNLVSSIFLYVAFVVVIMEVILNPIEDVFCFSFFLIPCIRILDGTGITFLVNVLIVLPLIRYIVFNRYNMQRIALIGTILFFWIEGVHIVILGNYDNAASEMCWILAWVLCSNVLLDDKLVISKRKVLNYLVGGIFLSALAYLFCNMAYTVNIVARVIDGSRFEAYADDPNFYSLYICLSMAILLSCRKKNKIDYITLIFLGINGMFTASKMCMLLMGFVILATVVIQVFSKDTEKQNHSFIFKLVAMLFILILIFRDYVLEFVSNLLARAGLASGSNSFNWSSVTTGRSVIIEDYFEILGNNIVALLFGYGFQYSNYLGEATGHGAHNTYLDFILSWGIFGTLILVGIMVILVRAYLQKNVGNKRRGAIEWLPFITLLINFMDLGCLSATMFWFVLTAAYMSLIRDDEDIFEKEEMV